MCKSVSGAGDVDADGFDDLLIGAAWEDDGSFTDAGAAYLVLGSSAGVPTMSLVGADAKLWGEAAFDVAGSLVSDAGAVNGDGSRCLHMAESASRFAPTEGWESKNPWLLEKLELAPDSGGPGKYRGGLGVEMFFQMTEDAYATATL